MFRIRVSRAVRSSVVLVGGLASVAAGAALSAGVGVGLMVAGAEAVVYGVAVMDVDDAASADAPGAG